MAIWIKWTSAQEQFWVDWVNERPAVIQQIIAKHNLRFDRLYLLNTTGQRVILQAVNEDGTLRIAVLRRFNPGQLYPDRGVFGIDPADLVECDYTGEVEDGAPYLPMH